MEYEMQCCRVFAAARGVARDFPGRGARGLAIKLKRNPGTFANQLAGAGFHKLGLGLAVEMTLETRDFSILHAFADVCGHLCFVKPDLRDTSDVALLDLFLARDEAGGEFAREVGVALLDGEICDAEFERIAARAYRSAAAVLEIVARLEGLRRAER